MLMDIMTQHWGNPHAPAPQPVIPPADPAPEDADPAPVADVANVAPQANVPQENGGPASARVCLEAEREAILNLDRYFIV